MAKARVLGFFVWILSCLLLSCGLDATPTPTPVEWFELAQTSDLSILRTYRARYAFRWEGVKDGQPKALTWDVLEEFVREPAARRFLWSEADPGAASSAGEMEFIRIGNDAYLNAGSGWMTMTGDSADIFKGNTLLNAPLSVVAGGRARLVERNVTINSVTANHYAFDESSLGAPVLGEVTKARGDVWVSTEFHVIVKVEAYYEGTNLIMGGGEGGVLDAAFDLMDINKPIVIQPPQGTQPAMPEDIPILEDTMAFTVVSGVINFKTAKAPGEVIAFYEAQMPAQGWTKKEGPTAGIITFTKGRRTAQFVIEGAEGKTSVMIMTTE